MQEGLTSLLWVLLILLLYALPEKEPEEPPIPLLGAQGVLLRRDGYDFEEVLAAAVIHQAAVDLQRPRTCDYDYATAVLFFSPSPQYEIMAAMLDLGDCFLQRCQGAINGREVVPVQVTLW